MANEIYCDDSATTYSDMLEALDSEAGLYPLSQPLFIADGATSSASWTVFTADYPMGIKLETKSGLKFNGNFNDPHVSIEAPVINSGGTELDGFVIKASLNHVQNTSGVLITNGAIDLRGNTSDDCWLPRPQGPMLQTMQNVLVIGGNDGVYAAAQGADYVTLQNVTVLQSSRFGVLRSTVIDTYVGDKGSSACYLQIENEVNAYAEDASGTHQVSDYAAQFNNYVGGDFRIKADSTLGLAGVGAFIMTPSGPSPDDISQSQLIDNISLDVFDSVQTDDFGQSQTIDNVSLTASFLLNINDISQDQAIDNIGLDVFNSLSVSDILQNQTIENAILNVSGSVSVNDIYQEQSIDNAELDVFDSITLQSVNQNQNIGNATLDIFNSVVLQDIRQNQSIDNIGLVVSGVIGVNDLNQYQTIENATISVLGSISVDDILQNQTIESVAIDVFNTIIVNRLSQYQTIDNIDIQTVNSISLSDLLQSQHIENASMIVEGVIPVNNLMQSQFMDNVTMTQMEFVKGFFLIYKKDSITVKYNCE